MDWQKMENGPRERKAEAAYQKKLLRDRARQESNRRAAGMQPQSESLQQTQPWVREGISRSTWYRQRRRHDRRRATVGVSNQ